MLSGKQGLSPWIAATGSPYNGVFQCESRGLRYVAKRIYLSRRQKEYVDELSDQQGKSVMMSKLSQSFQTLLHSTAHYPDALTPVALHGFLTAIAIGPEEVDDYSMLETAYGVTPSQATFDELITPIWDAMDEILWALMDFDFEPLLQEHGKIRPDPALWMRGFNQAVATGRRRVEPAE